MLGKKNRKNLGLVAAGVGAASLLGLGLVASLGLSAAVAGVMLGAGAVAYWLSR